MGAIASEIIEEIRTRCNIVDIIGATVKLKKSGGNSFKGLCPFHQEKTPSFHVDAGRQTFHCFGCGKGGDVFRFVMEKDNLTFVDAVRSLAMRAGVVIPEKAYESDEDRREAGHRERIYRINAELCSFFQRELRQHPDSPVAAYLAGRGLDAATVEKFKIGAASMNWTDAVDYCRQLGFSDEEIIASGAACRSNKDPHKVFDMFRGRLVFPIENEIGRVVGFSARSIVPKPEDGRKYVNSPESPVFKKSRTMYALSQSRKEIGNIGMAIICEGQMDAIAFHRAGHGYAVAPLGSAFTEEQARLLGRYTKRIALAFDADDAGKKAFMRATEILLPLSMDVRAIVIPGGKDPDELYSKGGAEAVTKAIGDAMPWLVRLIDLLREQHDFSDPAQLGEAAKAVLGYLKLIPMDSMREAYLTEASKLLGISQGALASDLDKLLGKTIVATPRPFVAKKKETIPAQLLTLLELALNSPNAARAIGELLNDDELPNDNIVSHSIRLCIAAANNGDGDNAFELVRDLLSRDPTPEISKILVEHQLYDNEEQAVLESTASWRSYFRKKQQEAIIRELIFEKDETRREMLALKLEAFKKKYEGELE
ncbi:MAG: DNA primase [Victivallaceae bacterium]|nr:DNA primase [Victivallaceae bacterium]